VERPLRCGRLVRTRILLLVSLLFSLSAVGASCAQGPTGFQLGDAGPWADAGSVDAPPVLFPPDDPDDPSDPGGSFDAAAAVVIDDSSVLVLPPLFGDDAAAPPSGPPFDAGPDGECSGPLAPGDLAIDEILIASLSGTGDHGEWLEVASTRDCALDLIGLRGECPVGAKVVAFEVTSDLWIPARGSFVVADSLEPAVNHALPGVVIAWAGAPGDVLRNEGTTITLVAGTALIDAVTYPSIKLVIGTSMAFPADCAPSLRSDWAWWQPSQASWFPGFHGTPNAPNDDVACPDD
jgi:hypothetical protein